MAYKILYVEDNDPGSITASLEQHGFEIVHHDPVQFETSLAAAMKGDIDLLLLDFRLSSKKAIFDAPTLAQTIRTEHSDQYRDIPIVLISSEILISGYYKDFTSQDLFDFAISKEQLGLNLPKYSRRFVDLIDVYKKISQTISNGDELASLLNIPKEISNKISRKALDYLTKDKFKSNSFMASKFLLNHIVKPSGILIGEEILAARLGVDIGCEGWNILKENLKECKYTGIFSASYDRWWSSKIDLWWSSFETNHILKRLKASQRVHRLTEQFKIENLKPAKVSRYSKSDYFWTICQKTKMPLDPIDGFEKEIEKESWEDAEYYSMIGVSELDSEKRLKLLDRRRYAEEAKEL